MTRPLLKLLVFRFYGALLVKIHSLLNARGLLLLFIIALFVISTFRVLGENIVSQEWMQFINEKWKTSELVSLGLLIGCLTTVVAGSKQTLFFSSAEIDFLFTAPVTRTALITYKYTTYCFSAFLSALFISIFVPPVNDSHLYTIFTLFLALMFVQTATTMLGMMVQLVKRYYVIFPNRGNILFVLVGMAGFGYFVTAIDESCSGKDSLFMQCPILRELLIPFYPISQLFRELTFSYTLLFIVIVVVSLIIMFSIIVLMDRYLRDETYLHNIHQIENWDSLKKSGLLYRRELETTRSLAAPRKWGEIACVAWIQLLIALRNSRSTILFFCLVAVVIGTLLPHVNKSESVSIIYPMLYFLAVFVMPRFLVFDFRGSLEVMDELRCLPVNPWAVCAGYLLVPVVATSFIELITVVAAGIQIGIGANQIFLIFCALLTFNTILYLAENLIFIYFPARLVPVGRVDFDFLGRTLLEFVIKSFIIFLVFGIILFTIFVVNRMVNSLHLVYLAGLFTFTVSAISLLALLVWKYRRFDVTQVSLNN